MVILTFLSANYLVWALRETTPEQLYIDWATARDTQPPLDSRNSPESPIYCSVGGYTTISRILSPLDTTFSLLENCRLLTIVFENHNFTATEPDIFGADQADPSALARDRESMTRFLYNQITSAPPADEHRKPFPTSVLKHRYEAVRLASWVFAYALVHGMPLSKAASELNPMLPDSIHILIKNSLVLTDLSDCWGPFIGILLWVSLVAGACANPETEYNENRRQTNPEEGESRKWLAAVAVRCSIFLNSCEYGEDVVEVLRRFVRLTNTLIRIDEVTSPMRIPESAGASPQSMLTIGRSAQHYSMSPEAAAAHAWSTPEHTPAVHEPSSRCSSLELLEPSLPQKGFHDFFAEIADSI